MDGETDRYQCKPGKHTNKPTSLLDTGAYADRFHDA